jgi:signal transduction histidine kinase
MHVSQAGFPVLILDDDEATLTLERRTLERAGFTVIGAASPDIAREAIARDGVSLLILDYRLSGPTSGLDFFQSLRAEGQMLPAILVTSFSDESKVIEALRAGIRDVVPKSGDYLDYLPQAVSRIIEQVSTERRVAESEVLKRNAEERERLLESERAARAESERAGHLKDEFLATLSHELRTPLNAILGWTHLLRARAGDPRQLAEGLEIIERNARVQTQIVDDLLEMSRIISGKLRLDVQPLDLGAVIDAAIDTVRPAAGAKDIHIETAIDRQAGLIGGDPGRIQQILWNVLSNAIKFTPRGGRVRVALTRVETHVEVIVSDTGQGIKADFLPYLFDRFRQADASSTRQHRGMGLGLSIVKNLVEMHGGSVSAASLGEGLGATISIKLPLIAREAGGDYATVPPAAPPALAEGAPELTGLRLLIVDDEPDAREFLIRVLTECGARVEAVASSEEALRSLERELPDVLISDIGMPYSDGYELIRTIRRLPPGSGGEIPALALTAFARSEDRQRALLAGYQAHVAKPADPIELVTQIASLSGRLWPVRGRHVPR